MEERAGKHYSPTGWCLVRILAALRKRQLTACKITVQVDGHGKPTMLSNAGVVVPVGGKMAAILSRIASHDVTLDTGRLQKEKLFDLGYDPPMNSCTCPTDECFIADDVVLTPFESM